MVCKEAVMIETWIAELPIGLTHPAFIIAALWPVIAGTIGRSQGRTAWRPTAVSAPPTLKAWRHGSPGPKPMQRDCGVGWEILVRIGGLITNPASRIWKLEVRRWCLKELRIVFPEIPRALTIARTKQTRRAIMTFVGK
jgi:hypothetical protein